jgi:hypothetical protein
VSLLAGLTVLAAPDSQADAQVKTGTFQRSAGIPMFSPSVANQAINPNFRISPTLTLPQAAFNTAMFGQAISQVPAYAFGFNPYPQAVALSTGLNTPFPLFANVAGNGAVSLATTPASGTTSFPLSGSGFGNASLIAAGYGGMGGYGASMAAGYGGYGSSPYSSGYGGYGSYEDPYAGYLRGVAAVTSANGNYLNQVQQARLEQTQADSARLDLRRRILEEAATERKNWLNPETQRQQDIHDAYVRAAHEPPVTEILSGRSLNDLYNHVFPLQERARQQGQRLPEVHLDPDMLRQVNLVGAGSAGSVALLKDRGRLTWPLVLQGPEYEVPRTRLSALATAAIDQLRLNNPVGPATLRDMQADVQRMSDTLLRNVGNVSPTEYVEAKRFLGGLESAIRALQDPNVGNQLNQNWTPRAQNVAELVDFLSQRGLRFAPATPGDEPAFRNLHQRMAAYDAAMTDTLTAKK